MLGVVGEAVKDVLRSKKEVCQELDLGMLKDYIQFLVNETEDAIAIKNIDVIKFSPITPTIRWITIELNDGYRIPLMAVTNVKTVPYHIENFKKFYEKYKK